MKHILLTALALAALPLAGFAQSSAVPLRISFQSRVTDAAGVPIGNTTPVNRLVTLRIWDNPTATATTNRLYSESQTVTIASGEFSLLVGSGTAVTGETNASTLDAVFNGDLRYLGVTIDDGTTAADPEVTPRQQIVTAPYAFRAKVAESVLGAAITTAMIANNAVNTVQIADHAITTAKIADGAIVTADIADHAITAAKIADNSITTADLQNGIITAAKIGSDVGVWSTNGTNLANVSRATGNVGVGTTTPTALISAGAAVANSKIAVYDDGNTLRGGFGWQNNQFRLHLSSASDKFSFLNAESGTEIATLLGTGNVGIGTTTPGFPLTFASALGDKIALYGQSGVHYGFGIQPALLQIHSDSASSDVAFGYGTSAVMTETMRIKGNGNVGIGVTTPSVKLDVNGAVKANGASGYVFGGSGDADGGLFSPGDGIVTINTNGTERMRVTATGRVGIGLNDPRVPLEIKNSSVLVGGSVDARLNGSGATGDNLSNGGASISIITDDYIQGGGFYVTSDARVKKVLGRSSAVADLATLGRIEITDYTYLDHTTSGNRSHKKVIAQQIEKVYPQAVNKGTGNVPDIFRPAATADGWIELSTDLKVGEQVALVTEQGHSTWEVLEVQPGRFRTAFKSKENKLFVYGRFVNDFLSVDYEAIA
ncbi:MAG: tail fiber domain-containing protein, partial [Opitutaceae bacterium]